MNIRLVGQRHMQLTNPFGTSAGVGLSAADLVGICTDQRMVMGKQLTPCATPCRQLYTHRAYLHRMIVVTGNFKSP